MAGLDVVDPSVRALKFSRELESVLRVGGRNWNVRTYTQLISDAERRYQNYLDRLKATD